MPLLKLLKKVLIIHRAQIYLFIFKHFFQCICCKIIWSFFYRLIMGKPERKMKKGGGFHLDIVIICCINIICGFFGLPWICAATVRSIAHVNSLTVMSRTHAPGDKPHLIEVKEQRFVAVYDWMSLTIVTLFCACRISALVVSILVGLSVLMSPLLRLIPMAVLFGIFLYMGVASIDGIQFFDRIKIMLMPVKHHPQAPYVRRVSNILMYAGLAKWMYVLHNCMVVVNMENCFIQRSVGNLSATA